MKITGMFPGKKKKKKKRFDYSKSEAMLTHEYLTNALWGEKREPYFPPWVPIHTHFNINPKKEQREEKQTKYFAEKS